MGIQEFAGICDAAKTANTIRAAWTFEKFSGSLCVTVYVQTAAVSERLNSCFESKVWGKSQGAAIRIGYSVPSALHNHGAIPRPSP